MNLNLGCSDRPMLGYVNTDIVEPVGATSDWMFQRADLAGPWPWGANSVELVQADDVIEHIADKIHFMNELHRVLVPGGVATIITPNAAKGTGFWQDPTHKSGWVMNSFQYFQTQSFAHGRLAKSYGITAEFEVVELSEREYMDAYELVWKITAILRAVKR